MIAKEPAILGMTPSVDEAAVTGWNDIVVLRFVTQP
jgi:hypothetical protein